MILTDNKEKMKELGSSIFIFYIYFSFWVLFKTIQCQKGHRYTMMPICCILLKLKTHTIIRIDFSFQTGNIMSSRKRMISASGALSVLGTATSVLGTGPSGMSSGSSGLGTGSSGISTVSTGMGTPSSTPSTTNNASLALLWGATGEQEWTPALTTG